MIKILSIPIQLCGLIKKDALLLFQHRKYLYLTIALPLILSIIYITTLTPKEFHIPLGVCDSDETEETAQLVENLEKIFDLEEVSNCSDLVQGIEKRHYSLALQIPEGFSANLTELQQAKIIAFYDNSDMIVVNHLLWRIDSALAGYKKTIVDSTNQQLKDEASSIHSDVDLLLDLVAVIEAESLEKRLLDVEASLIKLENIDTEFLVNPVQAVYRGVYSEKEPLDAGLAFIFPVVALFITLLLASTNMVYDKKSAFLVRIKASRTAIPTYLAAKLGFFFAVVVAQFIIILLAFLLSGASLSIAFVPLIRVLLFIALLDTLIGLLIGLVSESEGIAVLVSLIIVLPLMFLSGLFYPLQIMPKVMQWLSTALPINIQISLLKSTTLFGQDINNGIFFAPLVLAIAAYVLIKRK